jgi:hypothetical protein
MPLYDDTNIDGLQLEKATNFLLREVYERLPTVLLEVDQAMADDDAAMMELLGNYYTPEPTPQPHSWRIGAMPNFIHMPIADYPSVAVWGHEQLRDRDELGGGWGYATARFMIQVALVSGDLTYMARFAYRYGAALQHICKSTTLGGLADELPTTGHLDISTSEFRETDDRNRAWYAQSVIYQFDAKFVVT